MQKRKKIWDNYIVVGEVKKSARIKFVVAAAARDGIRYLNVREFYLRQRDQVWKPGRDGITIPLDFYQFDEVENKAKLVAQPYKDLVSQLADAVLVLQSMPLSDESNAVWTEPKED